MHFRKQEKPYSCGASALRNCVIYLDNIKKSEGYYRKICKTDENGTSMNDLKRAVSSLGYCYEVIKTKSKRKFSKKLKDCLLMHGCSIVLVDNVQHWVAAIKYEKRFITIIDSDYNTIKTEKPIDTFLKSAYNFDKLINKNYYHSINIFKITKE